MIRIFKFPCARRRPVVPVLAGLLLSFPMVPPTHGAGLLTGGQRVTGTTYSLPLTASGITTSAQATLSNDGSGNLLFAVKADAANTDWYLQWNSLNLATTTYRYVQIDFVGVTAGATAAPWTVYWQDDDSTVGTPNSSSTGLGTVAMPATPFSVVIDLSDGGTNTSGAKGWGPGNLTRLRLDIFEAAANKGKTFTISAVTLGSAAAIPNTPPTMINTSPADNATGVSLGFNLMATFNKNIALTGTGSVTLRDLGPGPDTVINLPDPRVTLINGNKLLINLSSDLLPENDYAVQISADAIQDLFSPPAFFAGISNDTTWNFTTAAGPPPVGPNVVIFLLDDFGLTDAQQHPTYFPDGSPLFETPNIHRLASQGMRFNNAYAQPLCSASRSCLLSGQDTAARNLLHLAITAASSANPGLVTTSGAPWAYFYPSDLNRMPLEVETIAERLKAAGYVTWHAGKWHLSPSPADPTFYPVNQGFDKQLSVGGAGPSSYFAPFTMPEMKDHDGIAAPGTTGTHIAKHMQALAQNMIDDHLATDPTRPFFLYYPAYSVHSPHEAKKSLFDKYQAKLAGLPNSKHKHPVMAAQIEMADWELGSMMDYLDSKGLTNNTLFIFLSDNGGLSITYQSGTVVDDVGTDGIPDDAPNNVVNGTYAETTAPTDPNTRMSNMDPRRAGKSSLFEGGIRVPMIIRYPDGGISAASESNTPVHLTDIYQTILDYTPAVAKPGYTLDGLSLKPVLEQTGSLPERDIFIYFPRNNETWGTNFVSASAPKDFVDPENYPVGMPYPGGTAVIRYPYKMIARYSTGHDAATVNYQLYRMDLDPGEANNIAGKNPEVVDAMRKRLEAYYLSTNAVVPSRNPSYGGSAFNSPETTARAYLAAAGLAPNTPQTFLLSDPDLDARRNEDEFLQQTNPNGADPNVPTVWLYDNGSFNELRFAIPANVLQSTFRILDANGAVVFTPSSGLTLDGQYGPFFVYKPTNPLPGQLPGNYRISLPHPTPAPSLTPDTDGDGLPDAYENSHGLNAASPADGNTDNDGDGKSRGQEYLVGTSDTDANEWFRLWLTGTPPSSLQFNAIDQKAYRLYRSGNLQSWTLWEDFGVVSGDHQVTLPRDTSEDREFYRVEGYLP